MINKSLYIQFYHCIFHHLQTSGVMSHAEQESQCKFKIVFYIVVMFSGSHCNLNLYLMLTMFCTSIWRWYIFTHAVRTSCCCQGQLLLNIHDTFSFCIIFIIEIIGQPLAAFLLNILGGCLFASASLRLSNNIIIVYNDYISVISHFEMI